MAGKRCWELSSLLLETLFCFFGVNACSRSLRQLVGSGAVLLAMSGFLIYSSYWQSSTGGQRLAKFMLTLMADDFHPHLPLYRISSAQLLSTMLVCWMESRSRVELDLHRTCFGPRCKASTGGRGASEMVQHRLPWSIRETDAPNTN